MGNEILPTRKEFTPTWRFAAGVKIGTRFVQLLGDVLLTASTDLNTVERKVRAIVVQHGYVECPGDERRSCYKAVEPMRSWLHTPIGRRWIERNITSKIEKKAESIER